MKQQLELYLSPDVAQDSEKLLHTAARELRVEPHLIRHIQKLKQSIDARRHPVKMRVVADVWIDENYIPEPNDFRFQHVGNQQEVHIIGAGPAGLFAALRLIERGLKPVIFERGKPVRERRRDLAKITREHTVNPDSNYCFGEGGAGTYSDGKLYTRSGKRGDVNRVLKLLAHHGAEDNILYEAHPHIGTNKLPHIIEAIRETILQCGGEIHFNTRLTDVTIEQQRISRLHFQGGLNIACKYVILATGHSARDVFELLHRHHIQIEAKPFALGVRIEHPQSIIDAMQYHCKTRDAFLPPAAYSLVEQVQGKGVFSFCMCPGGIIAPASTNADELVVNGWSPSKRNNPFANSGMVVAVEQKDAFSWMKKQKINFSFSEQDPLLLMAFQRQVERTAYHAGGGKFKAPAQRVVDFFERKHSTTLPENSYIPGLTNASLQEVLPDFIEERLRIALQEFGKKKKGYFTNEAIVVATESRTSSPVRIPRDNNSLQHPQLPELYPCGEGAGYAGGIVSAAMDGEKVAEAIAVSFGVFK